MCVQHHAPTALHWKNIRYLFLQDVGWVLGPVWTAQKISPQKGFDPRTIQPAASLYTDYVNPDCRLIFTY